MFNLKIKRILTVILSLILSYLLCFNAFAAPTQDQKDLENMTKDLNNLSEEINEAKEKNAIMQTKYDSSKLAYEMKLDSAKKKIKHLYEKDSSSDFVDVLDHTDNIADLTTKYEYIDKIFKLDINTIKELKKTWDNVKKKKKKLAKSQKILDEKKAALEKNVFALQQKIEKEKKEREKELAEAANIDLSLLQAAMNAVENAVRISGEPIQATTNETIFLAAVLEREAGPNDYNAELAVATVVMNRVESPAFPNTIMEVLTQPGQFDGAAANAALQNILYRGPAINCVKAASDAVSGARYAPIGQAKFFWADWYASSRGQGGINVGGNVFF